MSLLQAENIAKWYRAEPVLAGISLEIRARDRIGLIGPNGCGKTTLLRILAGQLEPDRGSVMQRRGLRVGFLQQNYGGDPSLTVEQFARTAFQEVIDWAHEAERLAHELARSAAGPEHDELAVRFDDIQRKLHHADGFQFAHKIDRVLAGLGLDGPQKSQAAGTLSGGQLNRLMLAHLLLSNPDVMLLDEPSNHLDLAATEWLEEFLRESASAYVIVSHDRYLLDQVTDQTVELIAGQAETFPGNYTRYTRLKAERLEVQRRTYERQRQEIERLEEFIRRNHYGQKAAQAEDRRKKLAQIQRVAAPRQVESPPMKFPPCHRCGDVALRAVRLSKAYARQLFQELSFQLERGERWGILGRNGSGKTTLLRCLLEPGFEFEGEVKWGAGVRVGFFDQQLGCIADDSLPVDAIRPPHKDLTDLARRDLLAKFGIVGDAALQPIRSLSGGQRNRVALAKLAALEANFLVMDEPTNHLDLWSREALAKALAEFDGTVLIVSHDRYFVNQLCDHLMVFEAERVRTIAGNYDTYRLMSREEVARESPSQSERSAVRTHAESPRRKRRFPYRKVADLEAEIAQREAQLAQLHGDLSDPAILRDRARVIATKSRLATESAQLEQLYEHWQEACELN
jgi:ATP-binding cassette subfamily F protein 3